MFYRGLNVTLVPIVEENKGHYNESRLCEGLKHCFITFTATGKYNGILGHVGDDVDTLTLLPCAFSCTYVGELKLCSPHRRSH